MKNFVPKRQLIQISKKYPRFIILKDILLFQMNVLDFCFSERKIAKSFGVKKIQNVPKEREKRGMAPEK